ncbi:unnamed protein product [Merluccius merluccius]
MELINVLKLNCTTFHRTTNPIGCTLSMRLFRKIPCYLFETHEKWHCAQETKCSAAAVNNMALLSSALSSLTVGKETFRPEHEERVAHFSSAILQLCQLVAVTAGRQMVWATMGHRAMWLSHTTAPDRDRAGLIQGPLSSDGLCGPWFAEVLTHQQSVPRIGPASGLFSP